MVNDALKCFRAVSQSYNGFDGHAVGLTTWTRAWRNFGCMSTPQLAASIVADANPTIDQPNLHVALQALEQRCTGAAYRLGSVSSKTLTPPQNLVKCLTNVQCVKTREARDFVAD